MPGDFSLRELAERLERLERQIQEIARALEEIRSYLAQSDERAADALETAVRIAVATGAPLQRSLRIATSILRAVAGAGERLGETERLILEIVAASPGAGIRSIEESLRRVRGRASKKTVKRALAALERAGLVRVEYDGRRYRVYPRI